MNSNQSKKMRGIKKIENMDYYEILNLAKDASRQEIERAYHLGKATYSQNSLAHYRLLSEDERRHMLKKIEEAYQNLRDPKKKKLYDLKMLKMSSERGNKAYFRKSTKKLEIEDAEAHRGFWKKFKDLFQSRK